MGLLLSCSASQSGQSLSTPVSIQLELETAETDIRTATTTDDAKFDVRWILEIHNGDPAEEPVLRDTLISTPSPDGQNNTATSLTLLPKRYHCTVWMDYVNTGTQEDLYYRTLKFSSIQIPDNTVYLASEEHKDAFVYTDYLDLTKQQEGKITRSLLLERPLAKIEIRSDDLQQLIQQLESAHPPIPERGNTDGIMEYIGTLKVEAEYLGYFPTCFNAYTARPNQAETGRRFTSNVQVISPQEALLCYDYVFVNGSESAVRLNLTVRDIDGKEINRIENLEIPVKRGGLSLSTGDYLTRNDDPGIGIDPDYDGEIDITIPD